MNKYLIKREIQGASQIPSEKLDEIGQGSESVLKAMRNEGKQIEQEHSYIAVLLFYLFQLLLGSCVFESTPITVTVTDPPAATLSSVSLWQPKLHARATTLKSCRIICFTSFI